MKAKIFILTCFLSVFQVSLGQYVSVKERTSGYLGKRFTVGFNVLMGPSTEPQKALVGKNEPDNIVTLNRGMEVKLSAVLSPKVSLVADLYSSNTSVSTKGLYRSDYDPVRMESSTYFFSGTPGIRDRAFGLGFRFFRKRKGAIAPVGPYFSLGARYHRVHVDTDDLRLTRSASNGWVSLTDTYKYEQTSFSSSTVEIYAGAGTTTALSERLLLDYGFVMGYMPFTFYGSDIPYSDMIQSVRSRMLFKQAINLNIGLAYSF